MTSTIDTKRVLKMLISQAKSLKKTIEEAVNNPSISEHNRFVSYKLYAEKFNQIAAEVEDTLSLPKNSFSRFNTEGMKSYMDTLLGTQKNIVDAVSLETSMLLSYLESAADFVEDEFDNIANFMKSKLRASVFSKPEREIEIQNAIESLLIGRNLAKGIDYDRESGKLEYSGKEYIPDFVLPKLNLCMEVKLLREGRKSRIIDEINADITAYSKSYERLLFIVYDLGEIRDETEFRRDIENAGANTKVVIIKH
jgi:hypothetical protein